MKELTYARKRGFHHWICLVCGKEGKEKIPDQASEEYRHNPGNPILGVCGRCNGGSPSAGIAIGNSTIPTSKDGFDGEHADNPLSYARLDGDWGLYAEIAEYFVRKVKLQDKDDFRHCLILEIYKVATKYKATGKQLTRAGINRIAAYELATYWERERLAASGLYVNCSHCSKEQKRKCRDGDLYSQCRKVKRVTSLNEQVQVEDDGTMIELWQVLADDKALDLDAWIDHNPWLLGYPRRLVEIALKKESGIPLDNADMIYLCKWRKKAHLGERF